MIDIGRIVGAKLTNVPLINLRMEFRQTFDHIRSGSFRAHIMEIARPITTPYFVWLGMPCDMLTLLIQRGIIGLESYVKGAVKGALGTQGRLTRELASQIEQPFRLERTTASALYDALPTLVDPAFALPKANPQLWGFVNEFYKKIRNPVFHGSQLAEVDVDVVVESYRLMGHVYKWIDGWHSPHELTPGTDRLVHLPDFDPS